MAQNSDREELVERDNHFELIAENSSDLISLHKPDGSYLYASPASVWLLGFEPEELIGTRPHRYIHPDDFPKVEKIWMDTLEAENDRKVEYRHRTRADEFIWLETICKIVGKDESNAPGIIHCSSRDISLRKVNEQKLAQANRDLEAFSYSVSHDLRTPLRAIAGFSEILREDYIDGLDPEAKRLLGIIIDNTEKMGQLIDDILTYSRISRSDLVKSHVDMYNVFRESFEDVMDGYPGLNNRTSLHLETLVSIEGDYNQLKQVAMNLLSNAVKYSEPVGDVQIRIGMSETHRPENVYYVADNGVGFDARYSDKLFRVFQRLHSNSEFEGTGVGLSIAQRIIQRHGGRIWAESEPGEGAIFYFSIPTTKRGA